VDGGELYDLRTVSEFQDTYDWRRFDLPSAAVDCSFISPSLRSTWSDDISISFGVYDCPFGGEPMSPSVLTTTLTRAIAMADRWVWFYAEDNTYLLPPAQGGASEEWVNAVRAALPVEAAPEPEPIPDPPPPPLSPPLAEEATPAPAGSKHHTGCGLLGMEVAPIFLAFVLLRGRRRAKPA
jgi:hypothetical protein